MHSYSPSMSGLFPNLLVWMAIYKNRLLEKKSAFPANICIRSICSSNSKWKNRTFSSFSSFPSQSGNPETTVTHMYNLLNTKFSLHVYRPFPTGKGPLHKPKILIFPTHLGKSFLWRLHPPNFHSPPPKVNCPSSSQTK